MAACIQPFLTFNLQDRTGPCRYAATRFELLQNGTLSSGFGYTDRDLALPSPNEEYSNAGECTVVLIGSSHICLHALGSCRLPHCHFLAKQAHANQTQFRNFNPMPHTCPCTGTFCTSGFVVGVAARGMAAPADYATFFSYGIGKSTQVAPTDLPPMQRVS